MDFVKNIASQAAGKHGEEEKSISGGGGGLGALGALGGFGDKLNHMAGREAEKKEDLLDKGIDFVQEHVLKQGSQKNETATEQMKDKMIAGAIRTQYKTMMGKDFPINEKH